ncbi:hypothetical protein NL533_30305, partial [Klebsiella pneumoniae]|nr:hypothetical protein [Klebsiella pneumoniae]
LRVLERVSEYVGARIGMGRSFAAVLADPTGAEAVFGPDEGPFARVAAEVLSRLGGPYARLVRQPDSRGNLGPAPGPSRATEPPRVKPVPEPDP